MDPYRRDVLSVGHRGAAGHAPENTLLSIRKAIELGADWVEIDVRRLGDQLLVLHDERVDRTTNGRGRLDRMDSETIRALDAGQGEKIPFLSEVLEIIHNRAGLNIELKGRGTAGPVLRMIQSFGCPDDILVSSFHLDELEQLRRLDGSVRIAPLFVRPPRRMIQSAFELRAWSVNIDHRYITRPFVKKIHDAGMKVFVYTVNRIEDILKLIEMEVDGIISDYPERIVQARGMSA